VSVEAFEKKRKVTEQVIRRMVKHDGILIRVDEDPSHASQKLLRLHPSYDP
jgi:hypothetical protein